MKLLQYTLLAITVLIGVFSIFKDYKLKKSNKLNNVGKVLLILTIFSFIFAILLDIESDKDNRKKEETLNKRVDALKNTNKDLSNQMKVTQDTLSEKISNLTEDNYKLSIALSRNALKINDAILGKGYGIFEIVGSNVEGFCYGQIMYYNSLPIYDVTVSIADFDSLIHCKSVYFPNKFMVDQDCYYKYVKDVEVKTLFPKTESHIKYGFFSQERMKNLEIIFTSRGGRFAQQAVYKLQAGLCPKSYRLYKIDGDKLIFIKAVNELKLPNSYWEKNFFPLRNRVLSSYKDQ